MLAVFVIVLGFVTAAFIATVSAAYQQNDGSLVLSMETPLDAAKGFVLCMFVGPYVIAKNGLYLWVNGKIGFPIFSACILIAGIWSFCLGVVSTQTLVGLGIIQT